MLHAHMNKQTNTRACAHSLTHIICAHTQSVMTKNVESNNNILVENKDEVGVQ